MPVKNTVKSQVFLFSKFGVTIFKDLKHTFKENQEIQNIKAKIFPSPFTIF